MTIKGRKSTRQRAWDALRGESLSPEMRLVEVMAQASGRDIEQTTQDLVATAWAMHNAGIVHGSTSVAPVVCTLPQTNALLLNVLLSDGSVFFNMPEEFIKHSTSQEDDHINQVKVLFDTIPISPGRDSTDKDLADFYAGAVGMSREQSLVVMGKAIGVIHDDEIKRNTQYQGGTIGAVMAMFHADLFATKYYKPLLALQYGLITSMNKHGLEPHIPSAYHDDIRKAGEAVSKMNSALVLEPPSYRQ
jgi:hypothetical protein